MLAKSGFGIFKILSIFGVLVMIVILFGPSLIEIGKAARNGEWGSMLSIVGGRLFAIEKSINEETTYLLESEDPVYQQVFHLTYVLTLLFIIFFAVILIFRAGNWLVGAQKLSPSTDVAIIIIIVLVYLLIEFLYSYIILGTTIIPVKDGVLYFIRNIPAILNKLTM